jgi:hypothetical protein
MIYIFIYIIGIPIALSLATGLQHFIDLPYVKHLQPSYLKPWHNRLALCMSSLSWLGVIVLTFYQISKFKRVKVRFSYKELWDKWNENTSSL